MKTTVIGTRTLDNFQALCEILGNLANTPTEIISGGCNGGGCIGRTIRKRQPFAFGYFSGKLGKTRKSGGTN